MEDFIVAYDPRDLKIRQKTVDILFHRSGMTELYNAALSRYKDRKYGDIVKYGNRFWGIVEAESSVEAVSVFMEKLKQMPR